MILFDTVYYTGLCSSKNMVGPGGGGGGGGGGGALFSVSLGAILTPKRN